MQKKEMIVTVKCDICGEEISKYPPRSETFTYTLSELRFEVYYSGNFIISDVCKECNERLMTLLFGKEFLNHAQKL